MMANRWSRPLAGAALVVGGVMVAGTGWGQVDPTSTTTTAPSTTTTVADASTTTEPPPAPSSQTMADASPINCESPVAPIENIRSIFNGNGYDGSGSMVELDGPEIAWRKAGAAVGDGRSFPAVDTPDHVLFSVTLDGTTRQLTNGSYPVDPNYSNRTPGDADTPFGLVYVTKTSDGAIYVNLARADEYGTTSGFRWRFDDPCDRTVPGTDAAPAVPQTSSANYTG